MKLLVKLSVLCVCFMGLYIYISISTWTSQWIGKTKTKTVTSALENIRGSALRLHNPTKGHRQLRQLYVNELHSTLPNSPQVYQGIPDYTSRLKQADKVCKQLNITMKPNFYSQQLVQERYGLVSCPTPKVGTTFWRQTFDVLKSQEDITSPFLIGYQALSEKTWLKDVRNIDMLLKNSTKFMFAREPYGRLLSAYVSKLFLPTLTYWPNLGRRIVTTTREHATSLSLKCGHDVTFQELVKYLIKGKGEIDGHFIPQHKVCSPCEFRYDVIGKMESFQDDAFYLLDSVGALNKDIRFYDLKKEHEQDSMIGSATTIFNSRHVFIKCVTMHTALTKMWRVYQMRGLIDKTQGYPLTEIESSNITVSQFVALSLAAHKNSNMTARENKREAFLQAYQGIPVEDLKLLQKYFENDFKLFGYSSEPKDLFERNNDAKTKHTDFNYFHFQ